jgi:hypothetical protein
MAFLGLTENGPESPGHGFLLLQIIINATEKNSG